MNLFEQFKWLFVLFILFGMMGCSKKGPRPPKVDHISVQINITPFYEDLFSFPTDSLEEYLSALEKKYGDYFIKYCTGVIGTGHPTEKGFIENMRTFLSYEPNQEVLDSVRIVFGESEWLKDELEAGFKYHKYYFPESIVPNVYLHISGFNQSVVVDSTWLSVSVEKYLGSDCIFYEWLGIPVYLRRGMIPEKVAPDIFKAMAMSDYPYDVSTDHLLNQMVYQGQILYYVHQMKPFLEDTLLFNYSQEQLRWVRKNESYMWASMVEKKHLFSTDRMIIQRYVGESPFTYFFGQDSPGQTGYYLGYQIVQSFMKRHPEVALSDLMMMKDGQELFTQSRYRP